MSVAQKWVSLISKHIDEAVALYVYAKPSNAASTSELIWSRTCDTDDFAAINAITDGEDDSARKTAVAVEEAARELAGEAWGAAQKHFAEARGTAWVYQLQVLLEDGTRAGEDDRHLKVPEPVSTPPKSDAEMYRVMVGDLHKMLINTMKFMPELTAGHLRSLDAINAASERLTAMQTKQLEELFTAHKIRVDLNAGPRGPLIQIDPETGKQLLAIIVPAALIFAANSGVDLGPIFQQMGFDVGDMWSTFRSAHVPTSKLKDTLRDLRASFTDEQIAAFREKLGEDVTDDMLKTFDMSNDDEVTDDAMQSALQALKPKLAPHFLWIHSQLTSAQVELLKQAQK